METVRVHQEFKSRKLRSDPNDKTMLALQDFKGSDGLTYKAGTKFVAVAGGYDNPAHSQYSDLVIL